MIGIVYLRSDEASSTCCSEEVKQRHVLFVEIWLSYFSILSAREKSRQARKDGFAAEVFIFFSKASLNAVEFVFELPSLTDEQIHNCPSVQVDSICHVSHGHHFCTHHLPLH